MTRKMEEAIRLGMLLAKYNTAGAQSSSEMVLNVGALLRSARTIGRIDLLEVNEPLDAAQASKVAAQRDRARKRIVAILAVYGVKQIETSGDPRGYPVKIFWPGEESNTLAGREAGYGIGAE